MYVDTTVWWRDGVKPSQCPIMRAAVGVFPVSIKVKLLSITNNMHKDFIVVKKFSYSYLKCAYSPRVGTATVNTSIRNMNL